jgi:hypothetical protein
MWGHSCVLDRFCASAIPGSYSATSSSNNGLWLVVLALMSEVPLLRKTRQMVWQTNTNGPTEVFLSHARAWRTSSERMPGREVLCSYHTESLGFTGMFVLTIKSLVLVSMLLTGDSSVLTQRKNVVFHGVCRSAVRNLRPTQRFCAAHSMIWELSGVRREIIICCSTA